MIHLQCMKRMRPEKVFFVWEESKIAQCLGNFLITPVVDSSRRSDVPIRIYVLRTRNGLLRSVNPKKVPFTGQSTIWLYRIMIAGGQEKAHARISGVLVEDFLQRHDIHGLAIIREVTRKHDKLYPSSLQVFQGTDEGKIVFVEKPGGIQLAFHRTDGGKFTGSRIKYAFKLF